MSTELYLECDNCGAELEVDRTALQNNMRDIILYVHPCKRCIKLYQEDHLNEEPKDTTPMR
jgi:uncharacterized Zn finger protein